MKTQKKEKNAEVASGALFFSNLFQFICINLKKGVTMMTTDVKETQTQEKPEEKKPRDISDANGSCGCGCVPPIETK
jgi:hypothetical protein